MAGAKTTDFVTKVLLARKEVESQRESTQDRLDRARTQYKLAKATLETAADTVRKEFLDWENDADVAVIEKHCDTNDSPVVGNVEQSRMDLWMTHRNIWFLDKTVDEKGYEIFQYRAWKITKDTRAKAEFVGNEIVKTGNMLPDRDPEGRITGYYPETIRSELGRKVIVSWGPDTWIYRAYYDAIRNPARWSRLDPFIDAVNSQWEKIVAHDEGPSVDERIAEVEFQALQRLEAAEKELAEAEKRAGLKQAEAELEKLLSEATENEKSQLAAHEAGLKRRKRNRAIFIVATVIAIIAVFIAVQGVNESNQKFEMATDALKYGFDNPGVKIGSNEAHRILTEAGVPSYSYTAENPDAAPEYFRNLIASYVPFNNDTTGKFALRGDVTGIGAYVDNGAHTLDIWESEDVASYVLNDEGKTLVIHWKSGDVTYHAQ
ncbi:MAG: hypothetical protein IJ087_09705 [Eggerthellaceae bacterium]|nr:hypothetical protein [Eggerthellaceae bacterium]